MAKDKKKGKAAEANATEEGGSAGAAPLPTAREVEQEAAIETLKLGPLVFSGGAAIMAIEIVGVRLLAPHFGISVYVWGSILTVFMAALASGYWLGGKIADARPSFPLMNVLVLIGAALVILVPYAAPTVCEPLEGLGERWGPLWASAVLFWAPSMMLAMVSPFAVRLVASSVHRVGHVAGKLYALSTVGSIFGSWLTTFVLIGTFSLTNILLGCSAILGLIVAFNLMVAKQFRVVAPVGILLALSIFLPDAKGAWKPDEGETLIASANTPYHRVFVVESSWLNIEDPAGPKVPTIDLHFDRYKESGIYDKEPYHSTSLYTDFFHVAGVMTQQPKRACFIGAGGGLGPRTFRQRWPDMEIDIVDIDPIVLEYCEEYFHLNSANDDQMHEFAMDGRRFIKDKISEFAEKGIDGYDFVVLDAFTVGGRIPWHLTTSEYFQEIRRSCSRRGMLIMNVIGALEPAKKGNDMSLIFRSVYKSMAHAYEPRGDMRSKGVVYAFPVNWTDQWRRDPTVSRNIILVASNAPRMLSAEVLRPRVEEFDKTGILGRPLAVAIDDMLPPAKLEKILEDDDNAPILTDQFCPVETMPFYDGKE